MLLINFRPKPVETVKRKSPRSVVALKEKENPESELYKGKENYSDNAISNELQRILKIISTAVAFLSNFECKKAIEILQKLPKNHLSSPFIVSKLAIAAFECGNYKQSEQYFQNLRKLDNAYLSGLEIYSSVLWHLKKDKELSCLSKEIFSMTKTDPISWCIAGNSYSLSKQHGNAIKCFKRCIQIDESFFYAYTLLGHENIITENFEHSVECFKNALSIHPRHYNAWYGLGVIYLRQEKFDRAEYYFKKSCDINKHNAILMCNLGIVNSL